MSFTTLSKTILSNTQANNMKKKKTFQEIALNI